MRRASQQRNRIDQHPARRGDSPSISELELSDEGRNTARDECLRNYHKSDSALKQGRISDQFMAIVGDILGLLTSVSTLVLGIIIKAHIQVSLYCGESSLRSREGRQRG